MSLGCRIDVIGWCEQLTQLTATDNDGRKWSLNGYILSSDHHLMKMSEQRYLTKLYSFNKFTSLSRMGVKATIICSFRAFSDVWNTLYFFCNLPYWKAQTEAMEWHLKCSKTYKNENKWNEMEASASPCSSVVSQPQSLCNKSTANYRTSEITTWVCSSCRLLVKHPSSRNQ